jgi:hypothetical protein
MQNPSSEFSGAKDFYTPLGSPLTEVDFYEKFLV